MQILNATRRYNSSNSFSMSTLPLATIKSTISRYPFPVLSPSPSFNPNNVREDAMCILFPFSVLSNLLDKRTSRLSLLETTLHSAASIPHSLAIEWAKYSQREMFISSPTEGNFATYKSSPSFTQALGLAPPIEEPGWNIR